MKFSVTFLFFLLPLLFPAIESKSGDLLATTWEFNDQEGVDTYLVKLYPNGSTENLVDTFRFLVNFFSAETGISGYDQDNGIFYYATDVESALVFSADVRNRRLLRPLSFGATEIDQIFFEGPQSRMLFVIRDYQQDLAVVSWYQDERGYGTLNSQLAAFDKQYITSTLDPVGAFIYFIGMNNSKSFVGRFSTKTTEDPITVLGDFDCGIKNVKYRWIGYDQATKSVIGVAFTETPKLVYSLFLLNSVGKCSVTTIVTEEFGIAVAFSYNPNTRVLYMGWSTNGAFKLYVIDVATTKVISSVVIGDGLNIIDLEIEL